MKVTPINILLYLLPFLGKFMMKEIGLWHYVRVFNIFLMLTHLFIFKTDYSHLSLKALNTYHRFKANSHKKCSKIYLQENNRTPIKCNNNYCYSFSSFFVASFSSFRCHKSIDQDLENRFFLYDDPPYSSFFNSIWIPPKISI